MALPIKPKDTQEGCNPISSNCVIWQGPDIPCIKLCTGDSVSDTVAKLAEELCTITDQLNISVLDISCFGALSPVPGSFKDVIQLLIDKTCIVETVLENNGFDLNPTNSDCPDSCLVSVASCLQPTDLLGNLVTELPLKDYLILVGTRICTIIAEVNTLTSAVTDLQNRVTTLETEVDTIINNPTAGQINITSGRCIGQGVEKTIQAFVLELEEAYCSFTALVGTGQKITNALNGQCVIVENGVSTPLDNAVQLSNSRSTMANLPGWVPAAQYISLADAVSNLWRTVCDMREAIVTLQATSAACCGVNCNDIDFSFTATGIRASKFIDIYFSGDVPTAFTTAPGPGSPFSVIDAFGNVGVYFNPTLIDNINTGQVYSVDVSGGTSAVVAQAVWYAIGVNLQVTDTATGLACSNSAQYEFYNNNWCADRNFTLQGINAVPNVNGFLQLSWNAANNSSPTTYVITLIEYNNGGPASGTAIFSDVVSYSGGLQTYSFPNQYSVNNRYKVTVRSQQSSTTYGLKEISCDTDIIRIPL